MTAALLVLLSLTAGVVADERPASHRLIVGWDDAVIVCGPGTEAGMDSPDAIQRTVRRWKARGYQGVYWRVDEAMLPERFMTRWNTSISPGMNYLLHRVDEVQARFPVHKTLLAAAKREGIEVWAWYPTIYSNGAPPTGPGFKYPWLYENRFAVDHPEILTVDRAGNKQFMVWEYAYPEARRAKVSEFVQFAKDYGFKRFVACLRTEAAQNQPGPKHADQFGFNAPVVAEMQRRHGVDILTDPRFDYLHPKFDVRDPMLENWRRLRGEYLTQLYRELRAALNEIDPAIQIAVQIPGDRAGTCLGNWHLDWRTWIDEGLVNEIVAPVVLDQYEGYGPRAKIADFGYIDASVSVETVRAFIRQSKQPTARLIQAGGPATGYRNPPPPADGWRLDSWPDLWTSNMAERWEQWRGDLAEFGHIRFIEQSFDEFPVDNDGYGGGYGDFCHRPDLRSGPGYWEKLGDGTDEKPVAQIKVRRGETGRAMKLTRAADGSANLTVRHHSRHDRGGYPFPGDTAIGNGSCQLDFWMLRPDAQSAFVAYLQYDSDPEHRFDVGLYVTAGSPGGIHYREAGGNVVSSATMPVGRWQRITLRVDLQRLVYSAEITGDGENETPQVICRDVPYAAKFNAFNMVAFSPQGATGSELFLDDVSLRWTPSVMFAPPGEHVLARDGFEATTLGAQWKLEASGTGDIATDSDISFGREYRSLRLRGSGGSAQLNAPTLKMPAEGVLLVDLDILPRSDLPYLQMAPSPQATSFDALGIELLTGNSSQNSLLKVAAKDGRWHVTSGPARDVPDAAETSVACDAWHRFQLSIDVRTRSFRVLMQVLGEPPRELGRGVFESLPKAGEPLSIILSCQRSQPRPDGPAFDNVLVTTSHDSD